MSRKRKPITDALEIIQADISTVVPDESRLTRHKETNKKKA